MLLSIHEPTGAAKLGFTAVEETIQVQRADHRHDHDATDEGADTAPTGVAAAATDDTYLNKLTHDSRTADDKAFSPLDNRC